VSILLARFVQVEVTEPQLRERQHNGFRFALELQDCRVHAVGWGPLIEAGDATGDHKVYDTDDIAEI